MGQGKQEIENEWTQEIIYIILKPWLSKHNCIHISLLHN